MQSSSPPLFEDLHRAVKEIQPMITDGIRLCLNRPLSPNLQLSHSVTMGLMHSSYKLGTSYMGTQKISQFESYPLLASEIQPDGTMNANFIHLINPRLKAKFVASFARNQCTGSQAALDYQGDKFTTSFTAANIDLVKNNGFLVGHLLQQFTERIALGPELVIQYEQQKNVLRTMSQLSLGGRYTSNDYHVDATVSTSGLHVSYHHKANESLRFGADLMTDKQIGRSSAGIYYLYEMSKAHMTFRGSLDTAWNVGAVLEKRFAPLPVVLSMSAFLNHVKNSTTVGLGLTVG